MGKRRGRTGPGGAVVSSLSKNTGGTIKTNRHEGRSDASQSSASASGARRREDPELLELAQISKQGNKKREAGSASESLSAPRAAPKWLGKPPSQMLREWCARNDRKRP